MANTYSQITIQSVFAVKNRQNLITSPWRDDLHKYISGIISDSGCNSLAVGGWQDHVHVLFGLPVTMCIADVMRLVKTNSSKWINENNFLQTKFNWQRGYGAFSYSRSQRDILIPYIMNQEQHHGMVSFKDEYTEMLQKFEVIYEDEFLFEFFE